MRFWYSYIDFRISINHGLLDRGRSGSGPCYIGTSKLKSSSGRCIYRCRPTKRTW